MRRTRKPLAAAIALALVAALGVGATLAWLTDEESVANTFTVGNIDIDLWEHDYDPETGALTDDKVEANDDYKMVPGTTLPKDPTVTVEAGSEDCWLFIKVEETGGAVSWTEKGAAGEDVPQSRTFDDFIDYDVDPNNWTKLDGVDGVYYLYARGVTSDRDIKVLLDQQVKVKDTVTKQMMDAFDADGNGKLSETELKNLPKLTFTAYAVQRAGFETAADAWKATFGAPQGA